MIQEDNIKRMPRRKDAYFQQVKCVCGCKTFTAEVFPVTPGEPGTEDEGEPNVNARVIGVVEWCARHVRKPFFTTDVSIMSVRLVANNDTLYALGDDGTVWRHSFQTSTGEVYGRRQVGYRDMKWQWVRLSGPQPSVAKYLADSSQGGDAIASYKAKLQSIGPEKFNQMYQGTWPSEGCRICTAQGIHGEPVLPGVGVCYDHAVMCRICGQPCDPERPHECGPIQEGPYEQTR